VKLCLPYPVGAQSRENRLVTSTHVAPHCTVITCAVRGDVWIGISQEATKCKLLITCQQMFFVPSIRVNIELFWPLLLGPFRKLVRPHLTLLCLRSSDTQRSYAVGLFQILWQLIVYLFLYFWLTHIVYQIWSL